MLRCAPISAMADTLPLLAVVASALLLVSLVLVRRQSLRLLSGPRTSRSLLGLEYELERSSTTMVDKLRAWSKAYGTAYRLPGCFWTDILVVSDPRAIQHVLHTSAYGYKKPNDSRFFALLTSGRGIVIAEGAAHQRQRKLLNPAFSGTQLKQFLCLFQRAATRLLDKLDHHIGQDLAQVDIATFATKLTLDAVGESTFGHKFDALEGGTDDLFRANKRASAITQNLTEFGLLFRAIQRHMPLSVSTRLFTMFPTDEVRRLKAAGDTRRATARDILMTAKQSGSASREENKDILSVLMRSNDTEEAKLRMSDEEVIAQTTTIMQAGHHVTGVSMAWLFYDLATHPEDQQRVFNELNALRTQRGPGMELTASDYDAMPYFNAVIKESLRLHSVAPLMIREATFDDSIPLTTPVASTTGEEFSQIPVKKGQRVMLDFTSYHWLEDVWGTDAHTWNPSRFLDPEMKKNQVNVGVYSNLLIFSGGVQGCIGWRFALMEIQTMLAAVLERFEISIPDGVEIQGVRTAPVVPMVVGKLDDGMQVPVMMRRRGDTGGHS